MRRTRDSTTVDSDGPGHDDKRLRPDSNYSDDMKALCISLLSGIGKNGDLSAIGAHELSMYANAPSPATLYAWLH